MPADENKRQGVGASYDFLIPVGADMSDSEQFRTAVEQAGHLGEAVPEAAQRRLWGLFCRVTKGAPPVQAPPAFPPDQWTAWKETDGLSLKAAEHESASLASCLYVRECECIYVYVCVRVHLHLHGYVR